MGWLSNSFNNKKENILENAVDAAMDVLFNSIKKINEENKARFVPLSMALIVYVKSYIKDGNYKIELNGEKIFDEAIMSLVTIELYIFAIVIIYRAIDELPEHLKNYFIYTSISLFSKIMLGTEMGKLLGVFFDTETLAKYFANRHNFFISCLTYELDQKTINMFGLTEDYDRFAWALATYENFIITIINKIILSKQKYGTYRADNITSNELEEFSNICVHKFSLVNICIDITKIYTEEYKDKITQ